jgi:hypothetical protein
MSRETYKNRLHGSLRSFFEELDGEAIKSASAAVKVAAGRPDGIADPGGYQGKSTHPSAKREVADHLHTEQTGSRFTEHTSDVKEDIGAGSVEHLPEEASSPSKGSGNQDKRQLNIGARHAATGEDTSVERDFKGDKDDPGTTSVMKADDGEKYGSWTMQKFARYIGREAEEILADMANGALNKAAGIGDKVPNGTQRVPHSQSVPAGKEKEKDKDGKEDEAAVKAAAARGYQLAATLGLQDMSPEERAAGMIETIIKEAAYQGDLVGEYFSNYRQALQKSAGGEHPDGGAGEDHSGPGDSTTGANAGGGASGMGGGMGGGGMGGGDGGGGGAEDLLSQLSPQQMQELVQLVQSGALGGGGGGGTGGGMGGGMGGDAQGAAAAMGADGGGGGGQPGGGGMDPSGAAGPMGGDPAADQLGPEQTDDQLAGAMQDMQLSPEQLEGMSGKAASAEQRTFLLKLAGRVRKHVRSGKYDSTKRASSPAERQLRDHVKGFLAEVVGAA